MASGVPRHDANDAMVFHQEKNTRPWYLGGQDDLPCRVERVVLEIRQTTVLHYSLLGTLSPYHMVLDWKTR